MNALELYKDLKDDIRNVLTFLEHENIAMAAFRLGFIQCNLINAIDELEAHLDQQAKIQENQLHGC